MNRNVLDLIISMSGQYDITSQPSDRRESFKAYQVAKTLADLSLVPQVLSFIDQPAQEDKRKYAFDVLRFIGMNTRSREVLKQLFPYLKPMEDDENSLLSILRAFEEMKLPLSAEEGCKEMTYYAFDDRDIIRTTALRTLPLFTEKKEDILNTLKEVVRYHYDRADLKYAVRGLKEIAPSQWREIVENSKSTVKDAEAIRRIEDTVEQMS